MVFCASLHCFPIEFMDCAYRFYSKRDMNFCEAVTFLINFEKPFSQKIKGPKSTFGAEGNPKSQW